MNNKEKTEKILATIDNSKLFYKNEMGEYYNILDKQLTKERIIEAVNDLIAETQNEFGKDLSILFVSEDISNIVYENDIRFDGYKLINLPSLKPSTILFFPADLSNITEKNYIEHNLE
jgi:hypothetical protein